MAQCVSVRSLPRPTAHRPQLPAPVNPVDGVVLTDRPGVTLLLPPPETSTKEAPAVARRPSFAAPPLRPRRPGHDAPAFEGVPLKDHAALMKGLRRRWMSAGFKRAQHTLLLVRVSGDPAQSRRTARALGEALASLGDVFAFGESGRALLAPEKPLRHVTKIAEGLHAAVFGDGTGVVLSAGIALMHRDDDPTLALCNAERHLREAAAMPRGGVVCETDVRAYRPSPNTAAVGDQSGDAACNSTDSPQPHAET